MHTTPPPPPDSSAPSTPTPSHEDASKQRNAWIALSIIVLTPVLWAVGLFFVLLVPSASRAASMLPKGDSIFLIPLPVVVAGVIVVTQFGLRRGWHLRPWILGFGSVAATCVVILGVLALQALVSARHRNQDKIVLSNITRLAAAADQYYVEHRVTSVSYSQLVGPSNYLKELRIVNQESYPTRFTLGATITASGIAGARTITYAP